MLDQPLAFVDVETTGGSFYHDRIIEVGILRVEDGKVVGQLNQLVNPGTHLPPMITSLTGITPEDLEPAPTFHQIAPEVKAILEDALFVAHNATFDYGFVRGEFKREEVSFTARTLCTARLSRKLYPRFRHHNLDSLIERHGFTVTNRHRAFDDAAVLWDFIQLIHSQFPPEKIKSALQPLLKHPSLPAHLPQKLIDTLPESPGVYLFYGEGDAPLYVGKSVNIRDRVRSHLSAASSSTKERNLATQTQHIEAFETAGDLGAQLLESRLVKQLQPIFNRTLRRSSRLISLICRTNHLGYDTIQLRQNTPPKLEEVPQLVGAFRSQKQAQDKLSQLALKYSLCPKLVGLESGTGPCFNYHLGTCRGACLGKEIPLRHNLRLTEALSSLRLHSWPFPGSIIITETGLDRTDYHHFLNWCHLDTISDTNIKPHSLLTTNSKILNTGFDLDTYKIVLRYLNKPGNNQSISKIKLPIESPVDLSVGLSFQLTTVNQ